MAGFHFFLFVVGLGAAITVVVSIVDFSLDAYDTGVGDFFTYFVVLIDIAYTLGIGGLAIYTILAYLGNVQTPMNVSLEHGEYSDGTVVFHAPENALCEKIVEKSLFSV